METNMRMLAAYHKEPSLRHISHLDVQRTLHRALARAKIPVRYSEGFNPHPAMSFAAALATGMAGEAEYFDVRLDEDVLPSAFECRLNAALPRGLFVSDAAAAPEGLGSLTGALLAAAYEAEVRTGAPVSEEALRAALDALMGGPVIVSKRSKSGVKDTDIRPQILRASAERLGDGGFALRALGRLRADGGLRMELLIRALFDRLGTEGTAAICRKALYFGWGSPLPGLPRELYPME